MKIKINIIDPCKLVKMPTDGGKKDKIAIIS
jgi:hypothetical protein